MLTKRVNVASFRVDFEIKHEDWSLWVWAEGQMAS